MLRMHEHPLTTCDWWQLRCKLYSFHSNTLRLRRETRDYEKLRPVIVPDAVAKMSVSRP